MTEVLPGCKYVFIHSSSLEETEKYKERASKGFKISVGEYKNTIVNDLPLGTYRHSSGAKQLDVSFSYGDGYSIKFDRGAFFMKEKNANSFTFGNGNCTGEIEVVSNNEFQISALDQTPQCLFDRLGIPKKDFKYFSEGQIYTLEKE